MKVVSLCRLAVLCALSVAAFGVLGVASASANLPFEAALLKVCKKVPTGELGLWNAHNCLGTDSLHGEYAWSIPYNSGTETLYCVLRHSTLFPRYEDSLCLNLKATGEFEVVLALETFPKILGTSGKSTLQGKILTNTAEIECTHDKFEGQPETGTTTGKAIITYESCTSVKPAGCDVSSKGTGLGVIETEKLSGVAESPLLEIFKPTTGTNFVEIIYNGASCAVAGDGFPVFGSQMCTWSAEVSTPAVEHELVCLKHESALVFGTTGALYEGKDLVHVEGGLLWKKWPV